MHRFIPFRKVDIIEMCIAEGSLSSRDAHFFKEFCQVLQSIYHLQHYEILESLKNLYASRDPDADTKTVNLGAVENPASDDFTSQLEVLLNKANYEKLTESDLNLALHETSVFKIKLQVNFDDFAEVLIYSRGESLQEEKVIAWLGLKSKVVKFVNFDRVLIYIKFSEHFTSHKAALRQYRPGSTLLKLFQNVPKADLEMLFPNTKLQMRLVDKLMIGIPAAISGGVVLVTKLGATLLLIGSMIGFWIGLQTQPVELDKTAIVTLLIGLATLGAYLWKQFSNFKNRKLRFMQTLTKNLYFKNLDNNAGVFHRLIDEAEEEECKEALVSYYFLLVQDRPVTKQELDNVIETWFKEQWGFVLNFEIDDALSKLQALGLVIRDDESGRLSAIHLPDASEQLKQWWLSYISSKTTDSSPGRTTI